MGVWLQFLLCAAVITVAGTQLSKYGDVIAEKTGLGRTWIGIVLLASVTSLPELITGASAMLVYDLPDIAAGDVFGSCAFNLLIIALLDYRVDGPPLSARAQQGQVLTAAFGLLLLGIAGLGVAAGARMPAVGWVGLTSPLLLVLYLVAIRLAYLYERRRLATLISDVAEEARYRHLSLRQALARYALNAGVVVVAATWLPHLGDRIATITGLGGTFAGSIFVALATSLPEVVVSFAAVRMGAVDLAVGNLFGSNLFNMGILAVDDMLYLRGPLLAQVAEAHLITVLTALMMTAIAIIGLTYRSTHRNRWGSWDALGIGIVYVAGAVLLYAAS